MRKLPHLIIFGGVLLAVLIIVMLGVNLANRSGDGENKEWAEAVATAKKNIQAGVPTFELTTPSQPEFKIRIPITVSEPDRQRQISPGMVVAFVVFGWEDDDDFFRFKSPYCRDTGWNSELLKNGAVMDIFKDYNMEPGDYIREYSYKFIFEEQKFPECTSENINKYLKTKKIYLDVFRNKTDVFEIK